MTQTSTNSNDGTFQFTNTSENVEVIVEEREKAQVTDIRITGSDNDGMGCYFHTICDIPYKKLPLIKAAIEKILNQP